MVMKPTWTFVAIINSPMTKRSNLVAIQITEVSGVIEAVSAGAGGAFIAAAECERFGVNGVDLIRIGGSE